MEIDKKLFSILAAGMVTLIFAYYLGKALKKGRSPLRGSRVTRESNPTAYWASIFIAILLWIFVSVMFLT